MTTKKSGPKPIGANPDDELKRVQVLLTKDQIKWLRSRKVTLAGSVRSAINKCMVDSDYSCPECWDSGHADNHDEICPLCKGMSRL